MQLHNAHVTLTPVATLDEQDMVKGATPDATNNAMVANNAPQAAASLRLDMVRDISTPPSNKPSANIVAGLLDMAPSSPRCRAAIGDQQKPLHMHVTSHSQLRAECLAGSDLRVENKQGTCLQAVWTSASSIYAAGSNSMVVFPDPHNLPRLIDVSGLTSWGLPAYPKHGPTNTRVIVRLSQWQQDGKRDGAVKIAGKLPYAVAPGASAVIVHGCGTGRVECQVVDSNGRDVCHLQEQCVKTQAAAKAALMAQINASKPCAP